MVKLIKKQLSGTLRRAGVDEIRHCARPRLAPQRAHIGKADRQNDLGQSRNPRAHGARVERVAGAEFDAGRQFRGRLTLGDDDRSPRGREPFDRRRADWAVAEDADLAAHFVLLIAARL